jgi:periodic tryptophan protein 2
VLTSSISYTADGEFIIGGGNSKYVCIYDIKHRLMMKRITLTNNRSLDGTQAILNSKAIKDGIDVENIEDSSGPSDWEDRQDTSLPGSKVVVHKNKKNLFRVQAREIKLSMTGKHCGVATTEGFNIYYVGDFLSTAEGKFNHSVSKAELMQMVKQSDFLSLIVVALQLKDKRLLEIIFLKVGACLTRFRSTRST